MSDRHCRAAREILGVAEVEPEALSFCLEADRPVEVMCAVDRVPLVRQQLDLEAGLEAFTLVGAARLSDIDVDERD